MNLVLSYFVIGKQLFGSVSHSWYESNIIVISLCDVLVALGEKQIDIIAKISSDHLTTFLIYIDLVIVLCYR